ncbi:MAG: hypothetical protein KDC39_10595 [Actinobacteria bacterium]|nr:hypothetical protein [Actinomycetota bacterium]
MSVRVDAAATSQVTVVRPQYWLLRMCALLPAAVLGMVTIWISRISLSDGRGRFVLFDDAMISMTYARTFAETGELVWFPGAERVEGFTNPLYTMLMAGIHATGLPEDLVMLSVALMGLFFVLATGLFAGAIALEMSGSRAVTVAATVAGSCLPPLIYWSVGGLEPGLISAATVALLFLVIVGRRRGWNPTRLILIGVTVAVGCLTRPDFFVVVLAVAAMIVIGNERGSRLRPAVVTLGIGSLTMLLLTIGRYFYYGSLTPNTYDLKMGGVDIFTRLGRSWEYLGEYLLPGVLIVVSLWLLRRAPTPVRRDSWLLAVTAGAVLAASFYVGGDVFVPNRFIVPALVLASLLACLAIGQNLSRGRAYALMAFLLAWFMVTSPGVYNVFSANAFTEVGEEMAMSRWTAKQILDDPVPLAPEGTLAAYGVGHVAYWHRTKVVDLLGKNDRVLAQGSPRGTFLPGYEVNGTFLPGHNKYDYMYSIVTLQPDLVLNSDPYNANGFLFPATAAEAGEIRKLYQPMCRGGHQLLVLKSSALVDRTWFSSC